MNQKNKKLTIVLASGGTGGHIFPAEALASEFIRHGHNAILITDKRYKRSMLTPDEMQVMIVDSAHVSSGVIAKFKSAWKICLGILQARKLLQQIKPDIVVGFGGYPSFPTMMAAVTLRLKSAIHEQNSLMGKVNRFFVRYVDVIATSYREVKAIKNKYHNKIILTGNPVRPAIASIRDFPYPQLNDGEKIHILVLGGSQGAKVFSDIVPDSIVMLPDNLKNLIKIDQQCRKEDLAKVRKIYEDNNINADLASFFEDIPTRMSTAHLMISRSGASTIAEITVAGVPSILVPYPAATDNHQMENAKTLEKRGAALIIEQKDFTADILAKKIKLFIENPETLRKMASKAHEMGKKNAATKLMKALICEIE
jgi:UDP-N-acetylglucosamine--N-acetylmuramyl-(pentapeptide) pyrophosphoryl-undecaprenol N-acetylglucosamine transferase